ncbi:peptide-methionine (S)-S-oxide reductase [Christiangramia forsetii]|uniref:peptide-methionine (S)-S-oxide reductase n=2 Tax=Christiangramia forsetii TaxID=411153 RepID=A0M1R3_CHRFK|nr:peptide-methionine (S)-S-oxide reductase [Christiangramia forsetii]GGG41882.1 hypothetical protein GCM10011532_27090 [Christiangramia forsetii]CAL66558.1 peptide methionine sulfoxide reductase [Christiangramia forsetii KT0803]
MADLEKIGLGGGCHWCTEAVFQALRGVVKVEQGYVSSYHENISFSEGIIVHFLPSEISLDILIEIHLRTHKSTSSHSMRQKYRSAVYTFSQEQSEKSSQILKKLQSKFEKHIITEVLSFQKFRASREEIQNYYRNDPEKPFCKKFIDPKLEFLKNKFSKNLKPSSTQFVRDILNNFPIGYSEVWYLGKRYGVSKTEFNNGNSTKLYAEELGGKIFISLNFYKTQNSMLLKPCEMPVDKVLHFLGHFKMLE